MYTVKEVSNLLDLTEHTVRYYTDKGLVPDLQRDKNNNRLFNDDAINWLRGAKNLKKCGMSVEDIKKYVNLCLEGDSTIEERYEMIRKQKEAVLAQLEEVKLMAEYITIKEKHYRDIKNQVIPDNTNPAHWQNGNMPTCPLAKDKTPIAH
jgi:DNA-binding transcriptional MerR regulator